MIGGQEVGKRSRKPSLFNIPTHPSPNSYDEEPNFSRAHLEWFYGNTKVHYLILANSIKGIPLGATDFCFLGTH
jgi:hypothetical protein